MINNTVATCQKRHNVDRVAAAAHLHDIMISNSYLFSTVVFSYKVKVIRPTAQAKPKPQEDCALEVFCAVTLCAQGEVVKKETIIVRFPAALNTRGATE